MRLRIERGKTLLVDGPACIALCSGVVRVFGANIGVKEHVIVRFGKRIPLEFLEDSEVEILLGDKASYEIIDCSSIPSSWERTCEKILSTSDKVEVVILGGTDSGKSSFFTYLANVALSRRRKIALIDGDLGQSDIGPPGTLGLSIIKRPIIDPSSLQPDQIIFVGVTSPQRVVDRVIEGLVRLKDRALEMDSNFIVINTDGWVEGRDAVDYKRQLIRALEPNFVMIMQGKGDLTTLVNSLMKENFNLLLIETPEKIKRRDRETRKAIREGLYKKYLKNAKLRSIPLSWIKLNGNLTIRGKPDQYLKKKFNEILSGKVVYCESAQDCIVLMLKNGFIIGDEEKNILSTNFHIPIKVIFEGSERGLIASLENEKGKFLGIGIIHSIDYDRGIIKVYTNSEEDFSRVHVGRIRLNEKGNEVEVIGENGVYILPQRDKAP
ncbi:MAG: Clp1/GlmU family protein [Candidatus Bathyarchaeia archaeon]